MASRLALRRFWWPSALVLEDCKDKIRIRTKCVSARRGSRQSTCLEHSLDEQILERPAPILLARESANEANADITNLLVVDHMDHSWRRR